jgi:8-oxo-dGTP diphosphatase
MKQYVVGFCFNKAGTKVLLIRKEKPEWQKGRLNGIGGKIENYDASPVLAMIREAYEEAGISPTWIPFGHYKGADYELYMFKAFDDNAFGVFETKEEEEVVAIELDDLPWRNEKGMIWNLNWMIPLALDKYITSFGAVE